MQEFIAYLLLFLVMMICYQFYAYAVSQVGENKQNRCRQLGIAYTSLGICALVFRNVQFVIGGLVLIMLGFRLIAHGLDRIDKKIFIDRYDEDQ